MTPEIKKEKRSAAQRNAAEARPKTTTMSSKKKNIAPLLVVDSLLSDARLKFVSVPHEEDRHDPLVGHRVGHRVDLPSVIAHLVDDRQSESRQRVDDLLRDVLSGIDLALLDGPIIPLSVTMTVVIGTALVEITLILKRKLCLLLEIRSRPPFQVYRLVGL